ncbi:MAG TPA: tetraacyldisaccharide 4'-kinase [Clostridia bacterium]|nr:tetraacyldisaccharide 4'-kinase [Clostridia bacterium]
MNPLSGIFGAVVASRNALYDAGVFPRRRLRAPVVSIGNISLGGAGKTPFTILLGRLLMRRGIRFDILSRGYGRQTRGAMRVLGEGAARQFGDEPLLMARTLAVPVFVGERRLDAGRLAELEDAPDLHLLDDGFQHRRLARDFDIVMLSEEDVRGRLVPSGRLREPVSSLRRADAVVVAPGFPTTDVAAYCSRIWRLRRGIEVRYTGSKPIVFCGIARPQQFFSQIRQAGIRPLAEISHRDHHAYSERDVADLLMAAQSHGADGFITTEKDSINLGTMLTRLPNVTIARVSMELDDAGTVIDDMLKTIDARRQATL